MTLGARASISMRELLGPDGHRACSGAHLVGGDEDGARAARRNFVRSVQAEMATDDVADPAAEYQRAAVKVHTEEGLPLPGAEAVPSFQEGTVAVAFKAKVDKSGYELSTMFPVPPPVDAWVKNKENP